MSEVNNSTEQVVENQETTEPQVFTDAQGNAYEAVEIPRIKFSFTIPGLKNPIKLSLQKTDGLIDIRPYLSDIPETCDITCYQMTFQGKVLNPLLEVEEYPEFFENLNADGEVEIEIVNEKYDEKSVRAHLTHFRQILTNPPSFSPNIDFFEEVTKEDVALKDFNKLMVEAKKRLLNTKPLPKNSSAKAKKKAQNVAKELASGATNTLVPDLTTAQFYASNFPEVLPCLRVVALSLWNPVPASRALLGDLAYIDVTTLDNKYYCITATPQGFVLNRTTQSTFDPVQEKSTLSMTLSGVLSKISPNFSTAWNALLKRKYTCHPLELQSQEIPDLTWLAPPTKPTVPKWNEAEACISGKYGLTTKLRDWNSEFQIARGLPKALPRERISRDVTCSRVYGDFTVAAMEGAMAVVDQLIEPVNVMESEANWLYVYNNILYVRCGVIGKDAVEFGGRYTPFNNASVDAKVYQYLYEQDLDEITYPIHVMIEYKGTRVIAYGTLPGLFQADMSTTVNGMAGDTYGDVDALTTEEGKARAKLGLETFARVLHNKPLRMQGPGNATPVVSMINPESKVLVEAEKNVYFMDYTGATPRDVNFKEPHHMSYTMLPKTLKMFTRAKAFRQLADALPPQEKDEKKELSREESAAVAKERKTKYLSLLRDIKFNCALYTYHEKYMQLDSEEKQQDIALLEELAAYVKNDLMRRVVQRLLLSDTPPSDMFTLEEYLESRGVPTYYVGYIYQYVDELKEKNLAEMRAELEKQRSTAKDGEDGENAEDKDNSAEIDAKIRELSVTPAVKGLLRTLTHAMIVRSARRLFVEVFSKLNSTSPIPHVNAQTQADVIVQILNNLVAGEHAQSTTTTPEQPEDMKQAVEAMVEQYLTYQQTSARKEADSTEQIQRFLRETPATFQDITLSDGTPVSKDILAPQNFWTCVRKYTKMLFNIDLPASYDYDTQDKYHIIRAFCLANGIKLHTRDYEAVASAPYTAADVHSINPIVTPLLMPSADADKMTASAKVLLSRGQFEAAFEYFAESSNVRVVSTSAISKPLIDDYLHFGKILFTAGDATTAIDVLYRGLIITQKHYPKDHIYCAVFYNYIAQTLNLAKKPLASVRYLLKSMYIVKALHGEKSLPCAIVHLNIALALYSAEKYNEAFTHLNQAITIVGTHSGTANTLLSGIFDLYGNMCLYLGDIVRSNMAYAECYKIASANIKEEADLKKPENAQVAKALERLTLLMKRGTTLLQVQRAVRANEPVDEEMKKVYTEYVAECEEVKNTDTLTQLYWLEVPGYNTDAPITVDSMLEALEDEDEEDDDVPYVMGSLYQQLVKKDNVKPEEEASPATTTTN